MSSAKKIIVIVGIVVIVAIMVVVGIVVIVWYRHPANKTGTLGVPEPEGSVVELGISTSSTRTTIPANIVVPNSGASSTSANVAIPVVQGVGDPAGDVAYRSFNISIQNNVYTPNTVIVNQGDTVNLKFTAVGAVYGFDQPDYGFNVAIQKGKTQIIQFQALNTGNFTFYCASCGGPSSGPVGHIIVVAK